jgi:hypothetical protein
MARRATGTRGGRIGASARSDRPCPAFVRPRSRSNRSGLTNNASEADILLERIDPSFIGAAELDAIEQFFGDIVSRALSR